MARAPVPGRVKTRLQPVFTPRECAQIQAASIDRTVRWAREVAGAGVLVARDGELALDGVELFDQQGAHLGERLVHATERAFGGGHDEPLIVVGTDTRLKREHAEDALRKLDEGADVVFGPALDGGYYLVALRRPARAVFELQPTLWGGRAVLDHGIEAAARAGLKVALLDRHERDLDTPEDAEALAAGDPELGRLLRRALRTPLVSVVIPTLDEAAALPGLLDHLAGLDGRFEAIVVDGGSWDGTPDIADAHPSQPTVIRNVAGGRAAQMNAGAEAATGDPIVFLHADTRLPENAHTTLTTTTADGGNFELRFDGDDRFSRVLTAWYRAQRRLGVYYGDSAIWLSKSAFDALGGFKPLPIMEDYDLARRLERTCLRSACLPGPATTSARRWRNQGIPRTVLSWVAIRWLFLAGMSPHRLARLYRKAR